MTGQEPDRTAAESAGQEPGRREEAARGRETGRWGVGERGGGACVLVGGGRMCEAKAEQETCVVLGGGQGQLGIDYWRPMY